MPEWVPLAESTMPNSPKDWIRELDLQPHPEGGWYREVYRSSDTIDHEALPPSFDGERAFSTAIYYLLGPGDFSALHRIRQDELWHFYDGSQLQLQLIHPSGQAELLKLGHNGSKGEKPLAVAPAGSWFGARVDSPDGFALAGCTVAPGFEFADFEMPSREHLQTLFPQHKAVIHQYTRT